MILGFIKTAIGLLNKVLSNKELMLVAISQIVGLATSVVFIKLVSHYASVSEYGLYSLALSIAAFIALFPFTSFDQAVGRYISVYQENNTYSENYTNILWLYLLFVGIILFLFILFYPFIANFISDDILKILNVVVIFSILNIFRTTILQIENFNRNRIIVLYSRIFEGIARLVLLVLIIKYSSLTADKILLLSCAIFLTNIIFILFYRKSDLVLKGLDITLLQSNLRNFYNFSAPLLIWAVFSWVQLYATVWFLQYYKSVEEVGYFTLINTIALIIPAQMVGIIGTFILPIMYQKENHFKGYVQAKTKEITLYLALLFTGILLMIFFAHNLILTTLSSEKYTIYSWILPYLFLAASFSNIAVIWTYEFFVYKKTKQLLLAQILPSFISVGSAYILISKYGILGAVYTLLITSFCYLLIVLATYYKNFIQKKEKP